MSQLTGQMTLFDFVAPPQQLSLNMTTDQKIIQYLFHDTKCVCCVYDWYREVEKAYYEGKEIEPVISSIFTESGDWSNTIFQKYTKFDFSELSHRRVGVVFKESGIDINYDASALDKDNWKHIKMSYRQVAEEIKKSIRLHEKVQYFG